MSDKGPAIDAVAQLDDFPPMEEGARKAEFIAGIEAALDEVRRGDTVPIEEVLKEMEGWEHE